MTSQDIANQRLINQQLGSGRFFRPRQLVSWMGCIGAADFAAAKWAIGMRISGLTDAEVERTFNEGGILRTHALRPEWQLVSPEDIGWMLALTAPSLRALNREILHRLGIGENLSRQCKRVITSALSGGLALTRSDLSLNLKEHDLDLDELRVGVILTDAELEGLICSGPRRGGQFSYMLWEERVPVLPRIDRETALALLAQKFFSSHGPATMEDFVWWSGLRPADGKRSMEIIGRDLFSMRVNGRLYWFTEAGTADGAGGSLGVTVMPDGARVLSGEVKLLPAFDEYTMAYQDKADILPAAYPRTGQNDIVSPVILWRGRVAGTWKSMQVAGKVKIDAMPAWSTDEMDPAALQAAMLDYARFLGKEVVG